MKVYMYPRMVCECSGTVIVDEVNYIGRCSNRACPNSEGFGLPFYETVRVKPVRGPKGTLEEIRGKKD